MENMLKDRVAIITGSGRGIGQAAARIFASEGARVVVSDIDAEPAEETVAAIRKAGGEAVAHIGDATAPEFAESIVQTAVKNFGGLHIIVNNAGFTWDSTIHRMTDEMWHTILTLHLETPFRLIRAASPYFRDAAKSEMEAGGVAIPRKIVNVSSTSGTNGNAGQANYSSAKAGLIGLTKTIAKEWGRFNIHSNAVAFGWVETRLTAAKEKGGALDLKGEKVRLGIPEEKRQALVKIIPMGRPGTAEEAANVIFYFASPLSNYVSGQVIEMNGGR
ncbi:SDR family oxidoreductase [bacterium]|nr:SDR family oxidoreductase [bacterium]